MLKTRVITAIALITGLLTALFYASNTVWALITLVITLLGVWEWSNLIKLNRLQMLAVVLLALGFGLLVLLILETPLAPYQQPLNLTILGAATLFWVVIAPVWLATRKHISCKLSMAILGLLLLLATWIGMMGLHDMNAWLLLAVIATVSLADSAAYFTGKRFGKHKLAPEISPGKTWEGVAGAIAATTIYGVMICYHQHCSYWLIVGLWLIVAFSIIGDLFESMLKRQAGIKDSSQLLPGHGSVLDRIDGFIPTMAIVFLLTYSPFFATLQAHGQ